MRETILGNHLQKIPSIAVGCMRLSEKSKEVNLDNDDFYHSYRTLKKDIEEAKNSAPTIVRAENIKVRNAFTMFGVMLAVCVTFLMISIIYRAVGFGIAEDKWDSLTGLAPSTARFLDVTSCDLLHKL